MIISANGRKLDDCSTVLVRGYLTPEKSEFCTLLAEGQKRRLISVDRYFAENAPVSRVGEKWRGEAYAALAGLILESDGPVLLDLSSRQAWEVRYISYLASARKRVVQTFGIVDVVYGPKFIKNAKSGGTYISNYELASSSFFDDDSAKMPAIGEFAYGIYNLN